MCPSLMIIDNITLHFRTSLLGSAVGQAVQMDSGKTNWQNHLRRISKDVQIAERSLAHDDEVQYQLDSLR